MTALIDTSPLAALGTIALVWLGCFLLGLLYAHFFQDKP